ncbi:MAG TPA: hypothetical protein DCY13_22260 [Verrucomicrobiales bacterium]|nr:hypothetical protein [Verrucomicrobiales bacterium]
MGTILATALTLQAEEKPNHALDGRIQSALKEWRASHSDAGRPIEIKPLELPGLEFRPGLLNTWMINAGREALAVVPTVSRSNAPAAGELTLVPRGMDTLSTNMSVRVICVSGCDGIQGMMADTSDVDCDAS